MKPGRISVVQRLQNLSSVKSGLLTGGAMALTTGVMTKCGLDLPDGSVVELSFLTKSFVVIIGGFIPGVIIGFLSNAFGRRSTQTQLKAEIGRQQTEIGKLKQKPQVMRGTSFKVQAVEEKAKQLEKEKVFAMEAKIQRLEDELMVNQELALDPAQKFIRVRELGRGGMGVVGLVWNTEEERFEVVKTIKDYENLPQARREELRSRFSQEAKAMSDAKKSDQDSMTMFTHPNVVEIYDFKEDTDIGPVIWMEYIDGRLLRENMHIKGKLPAKEAVVIAGQILDALKSAHQDSELQFIHRDISPENIILDGKRSAKDNDWVKLIDFGSVKLSRESDFETRINEVSGKPDYLAPEQLMGFAPTYKIDIWALGLILYEMLTGKLPFPPLEEEISEARVYSRLDAIKNHPIDFTQIRNYLKPILKRMLDRDKDKRPNHDEIRAVFDAFLKLKIK
ncbi:MAG: protein kinase [Candidatus Saganbacteria bacterium]|nr:protein kinase [Candidatus Saganbacteria bacterium]